MWLGSTMMAVVVHIDWILSTKSGYMVPWEANLLNYHSNYLIPINLGIYFPGSNTYSRYMTVVFHPISNLTMTLTIWMLLTVTCERHWALWRPLQHRAFDSTKRATALCIVMLIAATVFCLPTFFELRPKYCAIASNSTNTRLIVAPTQLRLNAIYQFVYSIALNSIFISIGPFLIITVDDGSSG
jgi:hypothetical protein